MELWKGIVVYAAVYWRGKVIWNDSDLVCGPDGTVIRVAQKLPNVIGDITRKTVVAQIKGMKRSEIYNFRRDGTKVIVVLEFEHIQVAEQSDFSWDSRVEAYHAGDLQVGQRMQIKNRGRNGTVSEGEVIEVIDDQRLQRRKTFKESG